MFVGVDDELKTRYPSEIMVTASTDKIMDCKEISDGVKETIKKSGRTALIIYFKQISEGYDDLLLRIQMYVWNLL